MTLPNFSLNGKVALITGGKRGIGKTIALTFAEAGADVVVCGRTLPDLEKVAEKIKALGRRSLAVKTDISIKSEVGSLIDRIVQEFGTIDILVNNAAAFARGPLVELSEEDWDNTVDTGLRGYFLCSQAAARVMMEKERGNIINIASTAGIRPTGRQGAYSIIKAAVLMLTKLLAVELAEYNIRVNALAPTVVRTELSDGLWSDPERLNRFLTQVPLGRIMEVDEMAGAALFLASDSSSYISGHTIILDGGRINTFPRPDFVKK